MAREFDPAKDEFTGTGTGVVQNLPRGSIYLRASGIDSNGGELDYEVRDGPNEDWVTAYTFLVDEAVHLVAPMQGMQGRWNCTTHSSGTLTGKTAAY